MTMGARAAGRLVVVAIALWFGLPLLSAQVPPSDDAAAWLRRAEQLAATYQEDLSSFVADESYSQHQLVGRAQRHRRTKADLLVLQTTGGLRWVALRSVYELDGQVVGDREERITNLFAGAVDGRAPAAALLAESARYNIGSVTRTVNGPTFALAYLDNSTRSRLRAERLRRDGDQMRVDFVEVARPTLTRSAGNGDLPAEGSVWLSTDGAHLMRTELKWKVPPDPSKRFPTDVSVRVTYAPDPRFGSMVPVEMREQYISEQERIWCTARYANVRRFTVETEEDAPETMPPSQ
jgi:hypothetical protein